MHNSAENFSWLLDKTNTGNMSDAIENVRKTRKENKGRLCQHCGWTYSTNTKMPKWKTTTGERFHLSPRCSQQLEQFIANKDNDYDMMDTYSSSSSPDDSSAYSYGSQSEDELDIYGDNDNTQYDGSITPEHDGSVTPASTIYTRSPSPSPSLFSTQSNDDREYSDSETETEMEPEVHIISDDEDEEEPYSEYEDEEYAQTVHQHNYNLTVNQYKYRLTTYIMMGLMALNIGALTMLGEKNIVLLSNYTL